MRTNSSWPIFISKRIFIHKRKRYVLGIFAQCYAYLTIWILSSLSLGLKENMVKRVFQRLDAYRFSLSKKVEESNTHLGISKMESPSINEAYSLKEYVPSLEVDLDITYLIPSEMKMDETSSFYHIELIRHTPYDKNIKIKNKTYINQLMFQQLQQEGITVPFSFSSSLDIYTPKENYYIHDTFEFHYEIKDYEVIEEYEFQNTPTIYLSFNEMKSYLKNHYLKRLSLDQEKVISYYDWLMDKPLSSKERNANLWLFVDNEKDALTLLNVFHELSSLYVLSSPVKENYIVFKNMSVLMKNVLIVILSITFILLSTLIGYLSYTHLLKDQHEIGIYFALGAKEKEIENVYQLLSLNMNGLSVLLTLFCMVPLYFLLRFIEKKILHTPVFLFNVHPFIYLLFIAITQILYITMIHFSFQAYQKKEIENLLKEED